ncbi:thiamine diphosphokinase [Mycoplasmoides pirum]|uniref:thiamine diphosphokinase n=1 Tax=Mycoplasmoides pirum TaxID=2122 RepID=UPI0004839B15|nr:thiamine diphosphokinase [Mycoplasmoides pirum]
MNFNLILNGNINKQVIKIINQYSKNSAKWIGVDKGSLFILKNNLKLYAALGDFDSVNKNELELIKENTKNFFIYPPEKDQTDFEITLDWLTKQKKINKIKIFGWNGGRLDQLLSNLSALANFKYYKILNKIEFIDYSNWAKLYLPGQWSLSRFGNMKYISFYSLQNIKNFSIVNSKYQLKNKDLISSTTLSSNEFIKNKKINFSFDSGIILVIQSKD